MTAGNLRMSRKGLRDWAFLVLAAAAFFAAAPSAVAQGGAATAFSAPFTVSSPALADGDFISEQNAAASDDCGGENVSPPVQWSSAPAGTRSFALTMFDPDGAKGLGVTHWIVYDLPLSVTELAADLGGVKTSAFVGGTNSKGTTVYAGPCPPTGAQPHHYVISVYALDLAPGTLAPGLDRDAFLAAIRHHSLAEASLVVRYQRLKRY